jgi:hypothetical protein
MLEKALDSAISENVINKKYLALDDKNPQEFCNYFNYLDDYSLQNEIFIKSSGKARQIIENIRKRNLYKRAYIVRADSLGIPDYRIRSKLYKAYEEGLGDYEEEIANKCGLSKENISIIVQNSPIKGFVTSRLDPEPSQNILIKMKNGEVHYLDQESPLKIEYKTVRRLFVFFRGTEIEGDKIRKACEEKFQSKSTYYPNV